MIKLEFRSEIGSFKNSLYESKISYNLIKFCHIWELKGSTDLAYIFLYFGHNPCR